MAKVKRAKPQQPVRKKSAGKRHSFWRYLFLTLLVLALLLAAYLLYLQAYVKAELSRYRHHEPASVYARSLPFREGQQLDMDDVQLELHLLGYRASDHISQIGHYRWINNQLQIFARPFIFPTHARSAQQISVTIENGAVSQLHVDRQPVREWFLDPVMLGRFSAQDNEDRELVTLAQLPNYLHDALLVTEDRHFYSHHGISVSGMLRAAWHNWRAGRVEQGGSTLTQQLLKNTLLTRERHWLRKINEVLMAVCLEWHFSKNDILRLYWNEVYFGQDGDRAIHGIGLAARYYFGKSVEELDLADAALLVAMIKGPSIYSPWKSPERTLARRNLVLAQLHSEQKISDVQWQQARHQTLGVVSKPRALSGTKPAILDFVRRELNERIRLNNTSASGLRLYTSFDPVLQRKSEKIISNSLAQLTPDPSMQTAMLVADIDSGLIRAVLAGRDASFAGFNRALDARRPVGSLLKPVIYYTALMQPERFTLATPLQDSAFVMRSGNTEWQPQNYDQKSHGNVRLETALSQSYNLATARLAMELGLPTIAKQLQQFTGQVTRNLYPSLALGSLELSVYDVLAMYSGFAHGSAAFTPRAITDIRVGETVYRMPPVERRRLHKDAAFLTAYALQSVVKNGTGKTLGARFPTFDLAGKTGTTNDKRDSWYAGWDGRHVAVFWMGRDDNSATEFSGASGALQLYSDWLNISAPKPVHLPMPESVVLAPISVRTGQRYRDECDSALRLPVLQQTPVIVCDSDSL